MITIGKLLETTDLIKLLKTQSAEIAKEGHAGWGNTLMADIRPSRRQEGDKP